jgi:hypothetical protein
MHANIKQTGRRFSGIFEVGGVACVATREGKERLNPNDDILPPRRTLVSGRDCGAVYAATEA